MSKGWTKNDIGDLTGKVIIVTGANSGLGYETCLALAEKNASVVLAVRNLNKGLEAIDKIKAIVPHANCHAMQLDLNDLASIREFVHQFKARYTSLSILINNAGIMASSYQQTKDGFESQVGINYLGHFALTGLLLDLLIKTPNSRVVSVGSLIAHKTKPQFHNFKGSKSTKPLKYYGESKLACMMFAKELQYRFRLSNISTKSIASHPGISQTKLFARGSRKLSKKLMRVSLNFVGQRAESGAYPILYAATDPSIRGGEYIGPDGRGGSKGEPTELEILDELYSEHVASNLWKLSETLTGVKYKFKSK
ncbi:NAD(P)-dependent dehydrogenase (short-subunit alcohol dehydrogenase family) [Ureibacillus xyleni]|uniref:NAD(P)-dependent dehydrogenase (Short-subunit alcohol dehydrogenase family) n=1 Tax=Ureibacillus xyleni TaxID=614648 RepID=A0A285TJZ4_9BACL|nr:oxidoreductase [Ureibacillus xyleni]SOC22597.1 NAD(P)-dependent dehydrogenase (short-subunit alcohol dehydrogenase family) [Ureibacillus xyleni]